MRDIALSAIKQIIAELIGMQKMKAILSLIKSAAGGHDGGVGPFAVLQRRLRYGPGGVKCAARTILPLTARR